MPQCETAAQILLRSIRGIVVGDSDVLEHSNRRTHWRPNSPRPTESKHLVARAGQIIGVFSPSARERMDILLGLVTSAALPARYSGKVSGDMGNNLHGSVELYGKGSNVYIFDCSYRFSLGMIRDYIKEYVTSRVLSAAAAGQFSIFDERCVSELVNPIIEDSMLRIRHCFAYSMLEVVMGLAFLSSETSGNTSSLRPLIIIEELSTFQYLNTSESHITKSKSAVKMRPFSNLRSSVQRALEALKDSCAAAIVVTYNVGSYFRVPSHRVGDSDKIHTCSLLQSHIFDSTLIML